MIRPLHLLHSPPPPSFEPEWLPAHQDSAWYYVPDIPGGVSFAVATI